MEASELNAENKVDEVASKIKVLVIGDKETPISCISKPLKQTKNFDPNVDFNRYLSLLVLDNPLPPDVDEDWHVLDAISVSSIKEGNQPRRYKFHSNFMDGNLSSCRTYNTRRVMDEVRLRLKNENWISSDVIETPLQTKMGSGYFNGSDQCIQQVISKAMATETLRLFKFILYLHREHVKEKKGR